MPAGREQTAFSPVGRSHQLQLREGRGENADDLQAAGAERAGQQIANRAARFIRAQHDLAGGKVLGGRRCQPTGILRRAQIEPFTGQSDGQRRCHVLVNEHARGDFQKGSDLHAGQQRAVFPCVCFLPQRAVPGQHRAPAGNCAPA